ncbi:MAG TPA: hypothetical protein VFX35_03010 [Solirubrobacterales bacterium]|nr:hypothetical protein [Solirubrobacterales bacterium]
MRTEKLLFALAVAFLVLLVPSAMAAEEEWDKYKIETASVSLSDTQAGAHADFTTDISLSRNQGFPYANTRDVVVRLPTGIFGNPAAFPKCTPDEFGLSPDQSTCPVDSQVGSTEVVVGGVISVTANEPIYNMPAPGGDVVARFGFYALIYPVFVNVRLDPDTNTLVASAEGLSAGARLLSSTFTLWGVPGAPVHDPLRVTPEEVQLGGAPPGGRPSSMADKPFMTNPTSCETGRQVTISARSYQRPESPSVVTVPYPQITGCESLEFNPSVTLKPTTTQATTGSGLDYEATFPTKGLQFGNLTYGSEMKRAEVILPEGMTINPSEAEGLGVCSEEDLSRERYDSLPGVGCPETSKVGTVEAVTPVIDRNATGSLYIAKPYENPFGSLVALYMVLKVPDRGVLLKLAGEVTLDPTTGRVTTVFDDIPQLPVAEFKLHFREGERAPLVTPSACGLHTAVNNLTPWSRPANPLFISNPFSIESGPNHGPCPSGGLPPFDPDLSAYPVNQAAGAFSPFYIELGRSDAEQEITHFSIKLPPGMLGKLADIPFCPDAAIAAAKARSGPHGGAEELAAPSCPAGSEVGSTWAGAGVGTALTYVPGKVYLAGPYGGSPLSVVSITAAKAGPFDLGTVVVREALKVDPETAEVSVDATGSDPIPHIVKGIPVRLRNIRVFIDRPEFVINPTDCKPTSTASTLRGAGLDFASEADDNPVTVSTPFQVADCAALGFKPKLSLSLKGGTKRNQVPALKAVLTARKGDANIAGAEVILPHSEFLEQGHIRTVCTRAQFSEGAGNGAACPAGSVYGRARAVTPLLSEPLEGSVYLRSNGGERVLPDLVAALHGKEINIDLVGYIGAVNEKNKRGEAISRIRTRFPSVPDAPVTKFVLEMQGGKKGLLVNSTDLCAAKHRADANFSAQNGRERDFRPVVQVQCGKRKSPGK